MSLDKFYIILRHWATDINWNLTNEWLKKAEEKWREIEKKLNEKYWIVNNEDVSIFCSEIERTKNTALWILSWIWITKEIITIEWLTDNINFEEKVIEFIKEKSSKINIIICHWTNIHNLALKLWIDNDLFDLERKKYLEWYEFEV